MIIIGGFGFYLNSIFQTIFIMQLKTIDNCMLWMFTIYPVHFTSLLSLVFRAKRILKLMSLEKEYINDLYDINNYKVT